MEGCHGVILTPQCWCGTYGNSDCNRHSAGADREGGAGGHSWYHQEDETTEDEDGPDTCKPRPIPVAPPIHTKPLPPPWPQDQYIFLHDAILESVMCGNTQIQVSNIQISLNTFEKKDPKTGLTGIESQLEV